MMENTTPSPASSHPFRRRGCEPLAERRYNFVTENLFRLALLAGLCCPRCGRVLNFDGRNLFCSEPKRGCLSWPKADTAEDEIYNGIT